MEIDEWAIGQRIASYRTRRGLTQEELAGLVGISLSMMKKIESGDRLVTRFSQLVLFAQILHVRDLRDLTGVPFSLMPDGRREHPAAKRVLTAMVERGRPTKEVDLVDLRRRTERSWSVWQQPSMFRYDSVGEDLPVLIGLVEGAVGASEATERRIAHRLASAVYQLVRTWSKRVGEYELSMLAADRAVSYALSVGDPDTVGAAAWNLAMILSAQGRVDQARAVVYRAIEDIQARTDERSRPQLAVIGGLHLLGASEAARHDEWLEASRLLEVADGLARRIGETNYHKMAFGLTNVAIHRMSIATELGRTKEALEIAERIEVAIQVPVERRLTLHLDTARCYVRMRNDVAAVHMLQRINSESPEEVKHSSLARETLRQISARRRPAIERDLAPLLRAASISA